MTVKEFNKRVQGLYREYNVTPSVFDPNRVTIQTPYGLVQVRAEHNGKTKISAIYSRVYGNISDFVADTGYQANTYNGKLNSYFTDPEQLLTELHEYINNILYLGADDTEKERLTTIYQNYNP